MLPLVVGRASPIPDAAFVRQRPGIEPGAPLIRESTNRIAMPVGEHGWVFGGLHPLSGQDRTEACARVGVDHDIGKAKTFQPGAHGAVEIAPEVILVPRLLGRARDRHEVG